MAPLWMAACCAAGWLPLLVLADLTAQDLDVDVEEGPLPSNVSVSSLIDGSCRPMGSFSLKRDFDIEEYSGSWHEVYVDGREAENCSTHVFSTASNTVTYLEKDYDASSQVYSARLGAAQIVGNAQLMIKRPDDAASSWHVYWVVDTDYISYSIVYLCYKDAVSGAAQVLRVLSRDYRLPSRVAAKVEAVLGANFNMSLASLTATNNSGCVPDECSPVEPVAQYMDVRQFAGRWHQMLTWMAYPARDDTALRSCASWLHSFMINSSMFVQASAPGPDGILDRMPALEASPVNYLADDGHFRIQQRIDNGARAVVQYDVLQISYNSWALVSVCNRTLTMNHLEDRAVEMYTMLLTRSSVAASVPWSAVSDTARKYDLLGLPVDFKTELMCPQPQCPDWVRVKAPFDKEQMLGDWYVIEETPTVATTGFCTTHRLRKGDDNDLTLLDMIQYRSTGGHPDLLTLQLSLADPSEGKFNVTVPFREGDDFPEGMVNWHHHGYDDHDDHPHILDTFDQYWILDTDYINFAVAYSCSGARRERVWLMSRGRTLSWAATRHILDVLVDNEVDVSMVDAVDWPSFCANVPDPPTDGPDRHHPAEDAAPPHAPIHVAVMLAVAVLVAVRVSLAL